MSSSAGTELRPGRALQVPDHRRPCLYDHLPALRQLVTDPAGATATVDVPDQALALVDLA